MSHLSDVYSSPSIASLAFSDPHGDTTAGTTANNTGPPSPDFIKHHAARASTISLGISDSASAVQPTSSAYLLEDPQLKEIMLSDVSESV